MRNIKFRGQRIDNREQWVYGYLVSWVDGWTGKNIYSIVDPEKSHEVNPATVGQFTGLKDKNGKEIYEGDEIKYCTPTRTTQTHTGDNIPNGSYTEPMEPGIQWKGGTVIFKDGGFMIEGDDSHKNPFGSEPYPLIYAIQEWDLKGIEEAIQWYKPGAFIFDDPEEGDLQYLMQMAKVDTPEKLCELFSGVEIIGTIHSNKELKG